MEPSRAPILLSGHNGKEMAMTVVVDIDICLHMGWVTISVVMENFLTSPIYIFG